MLRCGGLGFAFLFLVACSPDSDTHGSGGAGGTGGSGAVSGGTAASGHGGSGGTPIVDMGSGPDGPWPCTASVPVELPAVPVRGTVTGKGVDGTLCAGGIAAMAQDFTNPDTGEIVTALVFIGPGTTTPRFQFEMPSGIDAANLEGRIGIGSGHAEPGTFTNADSCGAFLFAGGTASGEILLLYSASAASNCESEGFIAGSWSLTVDSLQPVPQDSAGTAYITHGELSLTMEGDVPQDTVEVSLEF